MKTNLITLLAVTVTSLATSPVLFNRAVGQATVTAATAPSVAPEWKSHIVANTPAGLSATSVRWAATSPDAPVQFKVTFRTDAARFQVVPLFPANCPAQVEALRKSLEAEHKPLSCLRQTVPAGTDIIVSGSFVVRLDGSLSPIVWDDQVQGSVLKDATLPLEDSVYVTDIRAKSKSAAKKQMFADARGVVKAVGSMSSKVATLTGSKEAATVAEISRQLGADASTNEVSIASAVESGAGMLRALPAAFRK